MYIDRRSFAARQRMDAVTHVREADDAFNLAGLIEGLLPCASVSQERQQALFARPRPVCIYTPDNAQNDMAGVHTQRASLRPH